MSLSGVVGLYDAYGAGYGSGPPLPPDLKTAVLAAACSRDGPFACAAARGGEVTTFGMTAEGGDEFKAALVATAVGFAGDCA